MEYGLVGLIVLLLSIYAIYQVLTSSAGTGAKIIWTLVLIVLPLVGFLVWLLAGPRGASVRLQPMRPHTLHRNQRIISCIASSPPPRLR